MTEHSQRISSDLADFNNILQRRSKRNSAGTSEFVLPKEKNQSHAAIAARASRRISGSGAGGILGNVSNDSNASSVATSAANNARLSTYKRFMDMQKQEFLEDQQRNPNMHVTAPSILQRLYQDNRGSGDQDSGNLIKQMVEKENAAVTGLLPSSLYETAARNVEQELQRKDRRRSITFGQHFTEGKLIPPIMNEDRGYSSGVGNTRRTSAKEGMRLEAGTLRKDILKKQAKENAIRQKEQKKAEKKAMEVSRKRDKEAVKQAAKRAEKEDKEAAKRAHEEEKQAAKRAEKERKEAAKQAHEEEKRAKKEEKARPKKPKISWPQQRFSGATVVEPQPPAIPQQEQLAEQRGAGEESGRQMLEEDSRPASYPQAEAAEWDEGEWPSNEPERPGAEPTLAPEPPVRESEGLGTGQPSKDSLKKQLKERKAREKEEKAARQAKKEDKVQQKNLKKTSRSQQTTFAGTEGTAVENRTSVITHQSTQQRQEAGQPVSEEEVPSTSHPQAEAEAYQPERYVAGPAPAQEPSVPGRNGPEIEPSSKDTLKKQAKERKAREKEEKKIEKKAAEESRKKEKEAAKQAKKEEKIQKKNSKKTPQPQPQQTDSAETAIESRTSVMTHQFRSQERGADHPGAEQRVEREVSEEEVRSTSHPQFESDNWNGRGWPSSQAEQSDAPLSKEGSKKQAKETKAREKEEKKTLQESRKREKEAAKQAKKEEQIQQKNSKQTSQSQQTDAAETAIENRTSVLTHQSRSQGGSTEHLNVEDESESDILLTIPEEGMRPLSFPQQQHSEY